MQIIPFSQPGGWELKIALSGVIFVLNFTWNTLNNYWIMDIIDANGNPVIYGIVVVPNFDLTKQFAAAGMPAGEIVCQNIIGDWNPIGRFDMGKTTELLYYEASEIGVA